MEIFGIQFAPLKIPLKRRLQTLSAFSVYMMFPFLISVGAFLSIYTLFYTKYWFIALAYFSWIWVIDKHTPEQGGRRSEFFCSLKHFKYAKDYFPVKLELDENVVLDAKRNYLFGMFPHGTLPVGSFLAIVSNAANFNKLFPHHRVSGLTVHLNFNIPISRDILMLMGACSVSTKSINYLLSYPGGGRIAALSIGGIEEFFYAHPGCYQIVLKNRKGFVKLALKNGSPLVPVYSFGETEVFDQLNNPVGSRLRNFQEWCKHKTNIIPTFLFGRGFFQYTFGIVPHRKPITVVVGRPIEVTLNENPTQKDIDTLHSKFCEELKKLFDSHKSRYIKNSENAELIIC